MPKAELGAPLLPAISMTVSYETSVEDPGTHRIQVRIEIPDVHTPVIDLVLPSWVPGSYVIRDLARNLRDFGATRGDTGEKLPVVKQDKARWRVSSEGASRIVVRYTAYGHDLIVEGLDITPEHFFLNAGTFLPYVDGREREPLEVAVHLPPGWRVFTELAELGKSPPRFRARDYDELVDEPIDCGTPMELTIHPAGIPHRILLCGAAGNYEPHRLEEDLRRMVETTIRLFGGTPLSHYTFFYHFADARASGFGGLEHKRSTAIILPRSTFRPDSEYRRFLSISAHEYFHLYNVKRIRPKVLGPFDYTRENYTRLLWAMEGSTDYFTALVLRRSGLLTPRQYLDELAKQVRRYVNIPGRKAASLEELSFDSWINQYKPYEESRNQSVSYYLKGGLVTLCLDLEIRQRTENRSSVDPVFRELWDAYGRVDRGLEEGELAAVAHRVSGVDLDSFFHDYVRGTKEIDFARYLGFAGLSLEPVEPPSDKDDESPAGWLGVEFKDDGGRARISSVLDDAPARRAGLSPQDEVVALDGQKVLFADFPKVLQKYPAGSALVATVFRRGLLTTIPLTTGKSPPEKLRIVPQENPPALARQIYESWLEAKWEAPKPPRAEPAGATGVAPAGGA